MERALAVEKYCAYNVANYKQSKKDIDGSHDNTGDIIESSL